CGRFTATDDLLYYRTGGVAPFGLKSPALPPRWESVEVSGKFDLHWRQRMTSRRTFNPARWAPWISSVPIDDVDAALKPPGSADSFLSATGALIMRFRARFRMRVSWLMEAVAALAIVFAFLNWLRAPFFEEYFGMGYTNLTILRPRLLLAAVSATVFLLAL